MHVRTVYTNWNTYAHTCTEPALLLGRSCNLCKHSLGLFRSFTSLYTSPWQRWSDHTHWERVPIGTDQTLFPGSRGYAMLEFSDEELAMVQFVFPSIPMAGRYRLVFRYNQLGVSRRPTVMIMQGEMAVTARVSTHQLWSSMLLDSSWVQISIRMPFLICLKGNSRSLLV